MRFGASSSVSIFTLSSSVTPFPFSQVFILAKRGQDFTHPRLAVGQKDSTKSSSCSNSPSGSSGIGQSEYQLLRSLSQWQTHLSSLSSASQSACDSGMSHSLVTVNSPSVPSYSTPQPCSSSQWKVKDSLGCCSTIARKAPSAGDQAVSNRY